MGYGQPELYDVTFELIYDGEVANTVPLDAFHSRDREWLQRAHDKLVDIGCNIVRCWGGNIYEDHDFFDLCDEKGIMVWQDFALACSAYPQNADFKSIIEKEAASVVKKLRNHTSIILWSGDNEIDIMYFELGYHPSADSYNHISRDVLKRVVGAHDPYRTYLPSSPYIPDIISGDRSVPEQLRNKKMGNIDKATFFLVRRACLTSRRHYSFLDPEKLSTHKDG